MPPAFRSDSDMTVIFAGRAMSSEQQARAWAAANGYRLVPVREARERVRFEAGEGVMGTDLCRALATEGARSAVTTRRG